MDLFSSSYQILNNIISSVHFCFHSLILVVCLFASFLFAVPVQLTEGSSVGLHRGDSWLVVCPCSRGRFGNPAEKDLAC